jgi:hypothetical protein
VHDDLQVGGNGEMIGYSLREARFSGLQVEF